MNLYLFMTSLQWIIIISYYADSERYAQVFNEEALRNNTLQIFSYL